MFFFLTVHKLLSYINTGPDDFIHGPWEKLETSMLSDPAIHPVILLYNKLPNINHFQPPSRPSCQWKPNFKQRFHQIHSVHIVLQLVCHDLVTGLLVLWGQTYGIQSLVKNASWVLENWLRQPSAWICPVLMLWTTPGHPPPPRPPIPTPTPTHPAKTCRLFEWIYPGMGYVMHFLIPIPFYGAAYLLHIFHYDPFKKNGCAPPPPHPPTTLRSHLYCCSCAMKPDGRQANHNFHSRKIMT